ncbi:MAG TPA: MFS transporter [Longimicrobium sp.]|nr:MFS transporter [Longimicrobium sp.]
MSQPPQPPPPNPPLREALVELRPFLVIWVGQLVSGLGSGLTSFAVTVAVYQRTQSPEQLALLMLAWLLPSLLLAPVAGTLVDRWDRRRVLIASDTGQALLTLAMAALVLNGHFEVWYLFVISVAASLISAFQEPAFSASISALVPRRHYARAVSLMQLLMPASMIVAPLLGGALLATLGLGGIMMVDAVTYLAAIAGLLLVPIPPPTPVPVEAAGADDGPRWLAPLRRFGREAAMGYRFLRSHRGLFGLVVLFALANFWSGFVNPLLAPMVLAFSTPVEFATTQAAVGIGAVLGGVAVGVWGGPRRRIAGVIAALAVGGLCTVAMGLRPSMPLVGGAVFVWALSAPLLAAGSSAVWLSKTPQALLGRVFAARRMIIMGMMPLAVMIAGPLAERVFEPMLAPGGRLAGSVGGVIGVGPGRGIALMFLVLGTLMTVTALGGWLVPAIRNVERDVPDAPHAPHPEAPAPDARTEPAEMAAAG